MLNLLLNYKALSLVLLVLTPGPVVAGLLVNPGFEQPGGVGWDRSPSGVLFTASTSGGDYPAARSGFYKVKLEINSGVVGNNAFVSQILPSSQQPVSVLGNQQWTFSGYMLNFANTAMPENSYALLEMVFKGSFGEKSFTSEHLTPQVRSTSDVWDYASFTATAPEGSSQVSFYVRLIQGSENPSGASWGSVWFDDMNATVVEPVPELASSGWFAILVIGLAIGGRHGWRSLRRRSVG